MNIFSVTEIPLKWQTRTLQTLDMFLEHKYNLPFIHECTGINIEHQNVTKFFPLYHKGIQDKY